MNTNAKKLIIFGLVYHSSISKLRQLILKQELHGNFYRNLTY